eukprot:5520324-Pleurochrysis_carterae.AAC.6
MAQTGGHDAGERGYHSEHQHQQKRWLRRLEHASMTVFNGHRGKDGADAGERQNDCQPANFALVP